MPLEYIKTFPPLPELERGKSYVMGADPKGKHFLYTSGNGVIIRDLENPVNCDVYSQHIKKVTTAQYSPNGILICSADITGKIRIWEPATEEHNLRYEHQPIIGEIRDIAWGGESKRLAVCGKGMGEKYVAALTFDSGNSLGKLEKLLGKVANSVAMRQMRPFRLATGDDAFTATFFDGIPFKVKDTVSHSGFVNCVRYSPDGAYVVSGSADKHVFIYDGKSSEKIGEFGCPKNGAHNGAVYGVAWSADSKELLTVSGDKTAKIWNVETKEEVLKFDLGKTLDDMPLGCLWINDYLLVASLSGSIKYLDRTNPSKPSKILLGHTTAISKLLAIRSGDKVIHVSAENSGRVLKWGAEGVASSHPGHTGKVNGLMYDSANDEIVSAGWDDKISFSPAFSDAATATTVGLDSQPLLSSLTNEYIVVLCYKSLVLLRNKKKVFEIANDDGHNAHQPKSMAVHGNTVAVDIKENKIQIYTIDGDALVKSDQCIDIPTGICSLSYSPDGSMLAVGTANNSIQTFIVADGYKMRRTFAGHLSNPTIMEWSPDSKVIASGAVDQMLWVWNVETKKKKCVEYAHKAAITCLAWMDDKTLLSGASDCLIKKWSVTW